MSISVEHDYYTGGIMCVFILWQHKNIHPSPFLMSSGGTFNQAFRVLKISFLSPWNKATQGISIRPLIDCKLTVWVTSQSFQFSLTLLFSTPAHRCVQWVITCMAVAGSVEGKSNKLIIRPRRGPMSSQGTHKMRTCGHLFLDKDRKCHSQRKLVWYQLNI